MLYIDITRLYNNQRLGKTVTGVDRVSLAYVERFAEISCAVIRLPKQWLFFPKEHSSHLFKKIITQQPIVIPKKPFRFLYKKPITDNCYFLNTAHSGLELPDFLEKMAYFKLGGIYFLHDLIPIEYPEYCRSGEYERHQQRLLAMSKAQLVIANSNDVKNKFIAYCQQNKIAQPKIIYSHLGVDNTFFENDVGSQLQEDIQNFIGDTPFFLMIGTIEARKNHLLILNVWRMLVQLLGENCPKLVIVGKRGWEAEQVCAILDRSIELKPYVLEVNSCNDNDMMALLTRAKALLFPSYAEGYGLPLVEALKLRVPVIASDIAIFREIGLGVIDLLNPYNAQEWQQKIVQHLDMAIRDECLRKIERIQASLPTWDKHFEVVNPILLDVVKLSK